MTVQTLAELEEGRISPVAQVLAYQVVKALGVGSVATVRYGPGHRCYRRVQWQDKFQQTNGRHVVLFWIQGA